MFLDVVYYRIDRNLLLLPQVLYEKPNEYAAQFKFTVLLMPNGPHKITGIPFDLDIYQSDCVVDDPELKVRRESLKIQ